MTVLGLGEAYSRTAVAWQQGPGLLYDRLAEVVVAHAPVPLAGAAALDAGAGTGAASRALLAAGARVAAAVDLAAGMLAHQARSRPAAVVGDITALPFTSGAFDLTVAAFSLNHLTDPLPGLRELLRVTTAGGGLLAATCAADDGHPVKVAVEQALAARGWKPERWYEVVRRQGARRLADPAALRAAAAEAGVDAEVRAVRVPFPGLLAHDLVAWRLGMAQHAPFVAGLAPAVRAEVAADAVARLADAPPLVRSILILRVVKPPAG